MPLVLEYPYTKADYLAHHDLVSGETYLAERTAHYESLTLWMGVLLIACYLAIQTEHIFLMCLLVLFGCRTLFRAVPYSRRYQAAIRQSISGQGETAIRMEVREDGLHETMEGIQSFVPWSAVRTFTVFRDRLFLKLDANLHAIVPRHSLRPSPSAFDELLHLLRVRGIPESPPPPVTACTGIDP